MNAATPYEDANVIVHNSPIAGLGVFAKREFKKDEIVLVWHPIRKITDENRETLTAEEREHYTTFLDDKTEVLMGIPERFVNHSCDANTHARGNADVAIRDIHIGEEITGDYHTEGITFACAGCGASSCRHSHA